MDDLTKEFLAEGMDGLDRMERCLTELEQRPGDRELLDEIFRAVHTIKGSTGFLGLKRLELLAHAGESLLDSLREGRIKATADVVSGLLQLLDVLRQILKLIELTGGEGTRASDQDSTLVALLKRLNGLEDERRHGEERAESEEGLPPPAPVADPSSAHAVPGPSGGLSKQTLRVDVEVLNRMMNLVGELVLTRNQLLQIHSVAPQFSELTRRLDSVTADLRETVMQARMQPVGHLFGKFPRMIRDLARSCGKHIRLEFSGQETGLDKSLLEAIKDPIAHAVRNAVDHGIEDPSTRALAGKPMEGVIRLQARQHNGSVLIEISDDGRGISMAHVLEKAVARHLITAERGVSMSYREALQLLFLPGFSTSETVTHVSGRGVGMDVVLANVQKAGGTVELESCEGQGTTLRLRVPLTLAIVPALVVLSAGQSFCLPQESLAELVYVPERDAATAVESIGESELYRLREVLLPMVRLDRILGLRSGKKREDTKGFYLVVLELEGCRFGLVVDDILTPEEIVVKPLSPGLREIGLFSGATVLGSGMLAMIVDIAAIAARAGVARSLEQSIEPLSTAPEINLQESFLLFDDRQPGPRPGRGLGQDAEPGFWVGAGPETSQGAERKALPLRAVERIESVAAHQVEYVGSRALLRYQGELLALEDAGSVLSEADPDANLTILICVKPSEGGRDHRFGIVVRNVLDVAQGELLDRTTHVCPERLALVNDRLAVVHEQFCNQRVLEGSMSALEAENPQAIVTAQEKLALCWLTVDGRLFGIDTRQIREVLGPRKVQAVPLAPAFLAGILAYRGEVLPAVDLRCLLGLPPHPEKGCLLVLDGGETPFVLLVDRVGGVVEVEAKTLAANPTTLAASSKDLFRGAYRVPQGLLVQLDADRLRPQHLVEAGLFRFEAAGGVQ